MFYKKGDYLTNFIYVMGRLVAAGVGLCSRVGCRGCDVLETGALHSVIGTCVRLI